MTEHDQPTTPEQDLKIEHLVDTTDMSYALARAAVLGLRIEQPAATDTPASHESGEASSSRKRPKRRYHPVSRVPDADSAYDPNWNVTRDKLTAEEQAEQDALNAFGRAMVDNELDTVAAARAKAAETPREDSPEELQARKDAVNADWDRIEREIEDKIISGEIPDPIYDAPPDRRFFDPYNRKPTK